MNDEKRKIILHKTKPVKRNIGGEEIVRILGPIFCAAFFYLLILFGVRIAEFVISIIKIISEFKFFYLLSILSFIVLNFIFIFIILFKKGIKLIQLLLIITLSSFYIIEGTSFFLYVYEKIKNIAALTLLIISDVIFLPLFIYSFTLICKKE